MTNEYATGRYRNKIDLMVKGCMMFYSMLERHYGHLLFQQLLNPKGVFTHGDTIHKKVNDFFWIDW